MIVLLILSTLLLACGAAVYQFSRGLTRSAALAFSAVLLLVVAGIPSLLLSTVLKELPGRADLSDASYETSRNCRKCHPGQYESWHRTFHRTMTQDALPENIVGDFDDVSVAFHGLECRLFREGDEFFMHLVNPRWESLKLQVGEDPSDTPNPPTVTYPVDRLVGSHNMQVYLTRFPNGQYQVLPLVWLIGENRWITRGGSFLKEQIDHLYTETAVAWNLSCVFCHNTKPNPGLTVDRLLADTSPSKGVSYKTKVEELGIACESCHGPAEKHIAANHNPARRYYISETGKIDPTIVNPARLPKDRSVEVCGRCHGKWHAKAEYSQQWMQLGDFYIPGGEPLATRYEHGFAFNSPPDQSVEPDPNYFWPDWTPRPSALEYQAMLLTPCYQNGEMTCLSCHSMHDAPPTDQLKFPETAPTPSKTTNEACVRCHESYASESTVERHTHHPAGSKASVCYNCHMPYHAYGLLTAIRTHRITSPDVSTSVTAGLPNACNQCHIDRSLGWTAEWMNRWYRHSIPSLSEDQQTLSDTLLHLLNGHALNRALAASRLGWPAARQAAPGRWPIPFLAYALDDSYPAVRLLAYQSLRRFSGLEQFQFDYLGDAGMRRRQIEELRRRWQQIAGTATEPVPDTVPLQTDLQPNGVLVERLLENQDKTKIAIFE